MAAGRWPLAAGRWPLEGLTWLRSTAPAAIADPDPAPEPAVDAPGPTPQAADLVSAAEGRGVYGRDQEIADLRRALLDLRPSILHFAGHGDGEPGILLQGPDNRAVPVPGLALCNLFALFKDHLRCVVLNACYFAVQAEAIAGQIPFVIGMSGAIGDEAARLFSEGLYDGLGVGRDIETSWRLGCNVLELHGIPEQHIPVLTRDGRRFSYGDTASR